MCPIVAAHLEWISCKFKHFLSETKDNFNPNFVGWFSHGRISDTLREMITENRNADLMTYCGRKEISFGCHNFMFGTFWD